MLLPKSHPITLCVLSSDHTCPSATLLHNHLHTRRRTVHTRQLSLVDPHTLQPPANHRTGELASLAVSSQVDGIRGLIIGLRLSAACLLCVTSGSVALNNNVTTALIILYAESTLRILCRHFLEFIIKACVIVGQASSPESENMSLSTLNPLRAHLF